jgi:hypothetical protein
VFGARGDTMKRIVTAAAIMTALIAPLPVSAGDPGQKVGGVVEESGRTAGHAVRDGFLTFGRTVRDFFTGGPPAAKETWRENADRTKANAREGGRAVEHEAER